MARIADHRCRRADVDDPPPSLFRHRRKAALDGAIGAIEIGCRSRSPRSGRHAPPSPPEPTRRRHSPGCRSARALTRRHDENRQRIDPRAHRAPRQGSVLPPLLDRLPDLGECGSIGPGRIGRRRQVASRRQRSDRHIGAGLGQRQGNRPAHAGPPPVIHATTALPGTCSTTSSPACRQLRDPWRSRSERRDVVAHRHVARAFGGGERKGLGARSRLIPAPCHAPSRQRQPPGNRRHRHR